MSMAVTTQPQAASPPAGASNPPCTVCHESSHFAFERNGYPIFHCHTCGHRFTQPDSIELHVSQVYGDDYFFNGAAGYADYLSEARLLREHGRRYARILDRYTAAGTVLDIGAAAGFILQGFIDAGWSGAGIEPNSTMTNYARQTLGLDVTTSSLESFQPERQFDLVSLIQVIGHFIVPHAAVARIAELTHPAGMCLVETWNVQSWTARLFGVNWHEFSPPSVLQWFSPRTLSDLFSAHGMHCVAAGRPQKWLNAEHARSLLLHKAADGSSLARLASRLLKPIPDSFHLPYPAEDLCWMLFRKQR